MDKEKIREQIKCFEFELKGFEEEKNLILKRMADQCDLSETLQFKDNIETLKKFNTIDCNNLTALNINIKNISDTLMILKASFLFGGDKNG